MSFDKSSSFAHWKSQASISYSSKRTVPSTDSESQPRATSAWDTASSESAKSPATRNQERFSSRSLSISSTNRVAINSRSRDSRSPFTTPVVTSPQGTGYSRADTSSPTSSQGLASPTTSSFEKISVAQLSILLDANSDKDGHKKWDNIKNERAQRLLESGGSEVFAVFIRKAILLNFSTIFIDSSRTPHGTYNLLREQIDSIQIDPLRAFQIVDAIDAAKEEQFRSLDVVTFATHFLKNLSLQIVLTKAFTASSRQETRRSAEIGILHLVSTFANQIDLLGEILQYFSPITSATLITQLAFEPSFDTLMRQRIAIGIEREIQRIPQASTPTVIMAAQTWKLPDRDRHIIDAFKKAGPRAGSSRTSIEDVISSLPTSNLTPQDIANALLFMTLGQPRQHYNLNEFVHTIRTNSKTRQLDWNVVVSGFDLPDINISTDCFTTLFKALVQVAQEKKDFDIQSLWKGQWKHAATQASFLHAYFDMPAISPDQIPGFEPAFQLTTFEDATPEIRQRIESELQAHQTNVHAMRAIFEVILGSDSLHEQDAGSTTLHLLVRKHLASFMLSLILVAGSSSNWTLTQEKFIDSCFHVYLENQQGDGNLILMALHHQDPEMIGVLCRVSFHSDPRQTLIIVNKADELGWTQFLLENYSTPLALDIACLLQKESKFDLDQYITQGTQNLQRNERMAFGTTLWKFLRIKADDEYRHQKDSTEYQSIPLTLPAVFILLWRVRDLIGDTEQIKNAECTCLTTYPRLMNYGTDFDAILEKMSEQYGHRLAPETDLKMSDLFGRMYRAELSIRDMINEMRQYKTSQNLQLQDLFCCIVHGLFDEYGCYSEYPEEALEKTALLFGSIVKFRLLPVIPQEYGLTLIVDAVRDQAPETAMHRFGIEALLQVGDQLMEWPRICEMLLQIPGLQHPEIVQRAQEGLRTAQLQESHASREDDDMALINGSAKEYAAALDEQGFRSLRADPPSAQAGFRDPDERSQEKIMFVINNLAPETMSTKLKDMRDVLKHEHHQWLASYIVEQRARLEPNNHSLYKDFILQLDDVSLTEETIRQTYASIAKLMSARSTMDSTIEKGHLKSLGGWLGALTLARDRPIKHDNIYFVDLLLEGFESERLAIVIPFTCKVLVHGKDSVVFQPPNPWLMEILGVLIELYNHVNLKLNLKFEIEVLCKDMEIDQKEIEEADYIREFQRQQRAIEEMDNTSAIDNIDEYDLALRGGRLRETFSVAEIMSSLPNLDSVLRWPPPSGTQQEQSHVRGIISKAVHRAIEEIIAPVVERSITIASLSTNQLVSKDYATESDADKFRDAAHEMVKSLAGSLALVTCKEPLRMSIQNYIRQYIDEMGGAFMAEGTILMTVNDNLDIAAQLIKEAAENRALPEMDTIIEPELEQRRRHEAEQSGNEFYNQNLNRWSTWIPEPYKMLPGSLNGAQRAVYEEFARRVNGMNVGYAQAGSTDSTGRQLPDILNETLAMPNLSTPSGIAALPHQSPMLQHESRTNSTMPGQRMMGVPDSMSPAERLALLLEDISKAAKVAPSEMRLTDLARDSPISQDMQQILRIVAHMAPPAMEILARHGAEKITSMLSIKPPANILEAQALTALLQKLSNVSETVIREVIRWTTAHEEGLLTNPFLVAAFISNGLMEFSRVDTIIAGALREHSELGLRLLHDLMDQTMFNSEPIALRADFINSIVALYGWLQEEPDNVHAAELSNRLKSRGVPEIISETLSDTRKAKEDQMRYIFQEWASLYENSAYRDEICAKFLRDMHNDQIINTTDDLVAFLRVSIDSATEAFEFEMHSFRGTFTAAHAKTDALALLVILLVKYQGGSNGAVKLNKAAYFDTMLSMISLLVHHHSQMRGISFNARVFTRLFSSLLAFYCEHLAEQKHDQSKFMLAFCNALKSLQPTLVPAFAFGWTSLLGHRNLMKGVLSFTSGHECTSAYRELLGLNLQYATYLTENPKLRQNAEALLRGVYRNFFVLQNDYPDFVSEHHAYLCARVPLSDPAIRNVILSALPAGIDEPNPLAVGLRLDRNEDMRKAPFLGIDVAEPLDRLELREMLLQSLKKNANVDEILKVLVQTLESETHNQSAAFTPAQDVELLESLLTVISREAISGKFDSNGNHVQLLTRLLQSLQPRQQYLLILCSFDQVRYPNACTEYLCRLILHFWTTSAFTGADQIYIREIIIRILRERIDPVRPNPWGAVVVFKELTENSSYAFWDQPAFINEPELRNRLGTAARGH